MSVIANVVRLWRGTKSAVYRLSIVAVCKDERRYLPEWLEYHRLVGVEHFFIYDNESTPPLREALADYVERGVVTIREVRGDMHWHLQEEVYTSALAEFGDLAVWAAFIDVDEFMLPKGTDSLVEFLHPFESYAGGVCAHWQVFGSNGHEVAPAGLQIESYTRRAPRDWRLCNRVKSIVMPSRTIKNECVHIFRYISPFTHHNEDGNTKATVIPTAKIQINHYWLRSRAEFVEKRTRWAHSGASAAALCDVFDNFTAVDAECSAEEDTEIRDRFAARVRSALEART